MAKGNTVDIGVVVAGAGARGAYEAGILSHLMPEIAARTQDPDAGTSARFWVIGTSAGALNSSLIASHAPLVNGAHTKQEAHDMWAAAMERVTAVWKTISEPDLFRKAPPFDTVVGGLTLPLPHHHLNKPSVLDAAPLHELAEKGEIVKWGEIRKRVSEDRIGGIAIAAVAQDGRTVVFVDRRKMDGRDAFGRELVRIPRDNDRDIDYVDCQNGINPDHVLASSAIPVLFPAVRIEDPEEWTGWYWDGGVKLNTPLKPALQLGLKKLVIVSTQPERYRRDDPQAAGLATRPRPDLDESLIPVVVQLLGDQLIQDLVTLKHRNEAGEDKIEYLFGGPGAFDDLAGIVEEFASPGRFTWARLIRDSLSGPTKDELSSFIMFDSDFLQASVDRGRRQAEDNTEGLPKGREITSDQARGLSEAQVIAKKEELRFPAIEWRG